MASVCEEGQSSVAEPGIRADPVGIHGEELEGGKETFGGRHRNVPCCQCPVKGLGVELDAEAGVRSDLTAVLSPFAYRIRTQEFYTGS